MRICPSLFCGANRNSRTRRGHLGNICTFAALIVVFAQLSLSSASAQNMVMPPAESMGGGNGAPPMSASGDVNFFSQDLGTILRLRYATESYGQDSHGNFDVGSMQVITLDDSAVIVDGQVTMNEDNGVGFNVGTMYRWMNFPMVAPEGRVDGIGLFADGMHTDAGNFFPQIGVSYESLGELWDFRSNLYVPLGPQRQVGNFKPTGAIGFEGNSLSQLTQAGVDTSFTVGEIEIARRLGQERDAWGFAGPYFVANSDDSSAGYRVGVRGYAYPDLLLQFALSGDEIFHTEATFSLTWFVGRTRTNFQPAGNVADRIREPVMRNDYVALSKSTQAGGIPLTNPDGTDLRFIHVASSAAAGGNGSFEHPYNELNQANGTGSQNGDVVFAHSTSTFNTNIILKDDQKLLGEGNGLALTVNTLQKGTITIPESSPGARALARPIIDIAANTDAVTLANRNEIANFDMNGNNNAGSRAIAAPATGAGNPNIHDLAIMNTGSDAIFFKPDSFIDTKDTNGNGNTTETIVPGNVTINKVTLTNVGGNGINIDSTSPVDVTLPNVNLQELIALSNVTSTGGTGAGINIANTHTGPNHVTTLTNYTYDGGTTSASGLRLTNFDGTLNASTSTLTGGATTGTGIQVLGDTDGIVNIASTVTMTNIAGTDVDVNGDVAGVDSLNGQLNFGNAINNTAGRSVSVQHVASNAAVTFNGNITDSGATTGILVNSNSGGEIAFVGAINSTITSALPAPPATAVALTDNTGANIDFTNKVNINATGTANGFVATGGGTISGPNTTNTISTDTGQDLKITGMTIAAGGVAFSKIDRTAAAATNAIQLENNTGSGTPAGAITIGATTDTTAGDAGTIVGGSLDAISIKDSANVSITAVKITNTDATVAGVHVEKSNAAAMTTDLSNLEVDGGGVGIDTRGGGTGALTMTINDTALNGAAIAGARFNSLNVGTVTGTGVTIDGQHASPGADGVQINNSNATITFDATSSIKNVSDNSFEVNAGKGVITYNGTIDNTTPGVGNTTTGHSVNIHDVTGGSVTFGTGSTITDNNSGFAINNNSAGTIAVSGTNTLNTDTRDAVTATGNSGAAISMGPTTITTTSGRGVFANLNTAGSFTTGPLTITTTGTTAGTGDAFVATGNTGATINAGQLAITTAAGQDFVATGGGTLNVTGLTNTLKRTAGGTAGDAVDIEGMTIGAADFQSVNATGGANGVRLVNNTGGTITVGVAGNTAGQGGTITGTADAGVHAENTNVTLNGVTVTNAGGAGENAVEITHTNATAMTAAVNTLNVTNTTTAGQNGVLIDGTGGSGTFNASVQNVNVNANGDGFTAKNGVALTATGTNNITSNTGVGLTLSGISVPTGANFQNVTVTNGAGRGIVMTNVTGPGTVTVGAAGGAAESGGKLTTVGDAIVLQDAASVVVQHVHVLSAGGQGVNLDQDNSATTDMAVRFTDLDLDNVTGTGFDVFGQSNTHALSLQLRNSSLAKNVNMNVTGTGGFNMVTDSTAITTTGNDVGFELTFSGGATGNATFSGTNVFQAANAQALDVSTSGAANKTLNLNIQDGTFKNASATLAAANFSNTGTTTLNATVQSNIFDDSLAGGDFKMLATGAQSRIKLNLGGDDSTDFNQATGTGSYGLTQSSGASFQVFENVATLAGSRNIGTVTETGTFTDSATAPVPPTPPTTP